jgi:hypothetical protein
MCEEPPAIEEFNTLLDAQSSSPTGARARQPPIHSGLGLPIPIEGASRQANQPTQGSNWVHRLHCMGVDGLGCSRGVGSPSPGQPAQRQLQRRRPSRGTGSGVPAQSSAGLRRPGRLRCRCCERPWKAAWGASWSAVSGDLARIDQMEEAVRRMVTEVLNAGHLDDRRALRTRAGPAAKSWIAPCCWSFEGPDTSGS